ncbi:MAG TPA: hypothetical protein VGS97_09705 [Actinocrinis sp.]|uniref:hypothetical protein n=1 Tax=Actinocrinis sp. TaxID=1920516 RepID=UPI002DDD65EA|nr:hypothetical protein [Actinocrinis sp.]HEV2344355.1 hypothetical protein [Actinocrinis sp.]
MNLGDAFEQFQAIMEQLGAEVGRETLAVWLDRTLANREPLPPSALHALSEWAEKRLAEQQ